MLLSYREVAGAAQSYRAIGLSGGVCYRGIGKNFRSGLSGKTSDREMELPTCRDIGEWALHAIGLSGLSGDAQIYRAIGVSGGGATFR